MHISEDVQKRYISTDVQKMYISTDVQKRYISTDVQKKYIYWDVHFMCIFLDVNFMYIFVNVHFMCIFRDVHPIDIYLNVHRDYMGNIGSVGDPYFQHRNLTTMDKQENVCRFSRFCCKSFFCFGFVLLMCWKIWTVWFFFWKDRFQFASFHLPPPPIFF